MTIQNKQPTQRQIMAISEQADFRFQRDDEIDLIQLLLNIKQHWKAILLITFVGTLLSIAFALTLVREYSVGVTVSLPGTLDTAKLRENGLKEYSQPELLKEYYDIIRTDRLFKAFVFEHDYLSKLYPQAYTEETANQLFAQLMKNLVVEIDEPVVPDGVGVDYPSIFTLALQHTDEPVMVELLNDYVVYSNQALVSAITSSQSAQRDSQLNTIQRNIALLRKSAQIERELLIRKMQNENLQALNVLKQQKSLLINKARKDRETKIAELEESNLGILNGLEQKKALLIAKAKSDRQVTITQRLETNQQKLNELQQEKTLLIEKAAQDRATRIANADEALVIAKSMNIVYPTKVFEVNKKNGISDNRNTQINLDNSQSQASLPLYLMGSDYLNLLIKTLKERKDDSIFLNRLNQINFEIAKITDDQALKTLEQRKIDAPYVVELNQIDSDIAKTKDDQNVKILKERPSDEPFLVELNQLENQIELVKNDQVLSALKTRKSDDPFIAELATELSNIAALEALPLDFSEVQAYTLFKAAIVSKKPVKPNRKLIVILGAFLSGFVALVWALIRSSIAMREKKTADMAIYAEQN